MVVSLKTFLEIFILTNSNWQCIMPTLIIVQIGLGRAFSATTTQTGGITTTVLRLGSEESIVLDTVVGGTSRVGLPTTSTAIELHDLSNPNSTSQARTRNNIDSGSEATLTKNAVP